MTMRIRRLLIGVAALVLLVGGWLGYRAWREAQAWRTALVIPVGGLQPGTVQKLQGLWVARQPDGEFRVFLPFSDFYPDRAVQWDAATQRFVEPASSAQYTIDGRGFFGPAGNLYQVAFRKEGKTLIVLNTKVTSGGPDGAPAWLVDLQERLRELLRPQPVSTQPPALP
jgi:hypothetical protein